MSGAVPLEIPVHVLELDRWVDPACAIDAVAREPFPAVLDSSNPDVAGPRHTVLACRPVRTLEATFPDDADPFERLAAITRRHHITIGEATPYVPGWIGYFGYEAGRYIESLPTTTTRRIGLPDVRFALYDTIAVADHRSGRWEVVAADLPADLAGPRPPAEQRARELADLLCSASARTGSPQQAEAETPEVSASINRERFISIVRRAREYIAAGDIFQVNLCHQLRAPRRIEPVDLYQRLRTVNPAHYAAFLAFGDQAVLSASPELFLSLHGREVVTRPIKGTRPRTGIDELDAENRRLLTASEKDHAELAMIIDLERNDLGRVCSFGSVQVRNAWTLETHPTVYHLVATIAGALRPECDAFDLLRATFPGGSITGAPKVRAMQIIDELEETTRSVYCGAIGHIGLDGRMTLNIAIRTIIADGGMLYLPVGSGIVADSVPEDEYEETLAKGAGMLAAVHAGPCRRADARSVLAIHETVA